MKNQKGPILLLTSLYLSMLLIPFVSFGKAKQKEDQPPAAQPANTNEFIFRNAAANTVLHLPEEEFTFSIVAAEMSPEAPIESLKAQAVASRTYYSRLREKSRKQGASADFSVDSFRSKDELKKSWGDKANEYADNIQKALTETSGEVLQYDGELADTTYFAISSGQTENAADVWGGSCPYLISVASPFDPFIEGFQTKKTCSAGEFKKKIEALSSKADLSKDAEKWIGSVERSPAGTVKTITIGGVVFTGEQIRSAFGLRSADFSLTSDNTGFTFLVLGYGHDVGMSQCGAEEMAKEGSSYKEILSWYYPGTLLKKI